MKQKVFLITIMVFILQLNSHSQWISFDKENGSPQKPRIELLSSNNQSSIIKINLSGVMIEDVITTSGKIQRADILSDAFTNVVGMPEISYISVMLAIPENASLSYKIISVGEVDTIRNINLAAAREVWIEGASESIYTSVESNRFNGFWPAENVMIGEPSIFRDFRVAQISVFPQQYDAAKKELRIAKSITVEIQFHNEGSTNQRNTDTRSISSSFAPLYRSAILNYNEALQSMYGGKDNSEDVVLYLIPDSYSATLSSYIEWKKQSGYKPIVKTFSEIGPGAGSNPITIKDFITTMYNSTDRPTYVVLVGDDGVFPQKMKTSDDYTFPNENYFATVDGTDFIPDVLIGRLPVNSTIELGTILNRALSYEKTPYTDNVSNPDWFKKAVMCSNNYYASQVATKRFVRNILVNDGNFVLVDTLMSDDSCTVSLSNVLDAINEGRGFINYRGEGWDVGWMANCYYFETSTIDSDVNNGKMYPFITSIGCGVAMFNSMGGDCFAERWLKIGTQANPRGAVAFIGPTTNSHTTYNNSIDKGIYKGMFIEGMTTPGQALLRGKTEMYNVFGISDPYTQYHYEIFVTLGDPSTRIWETTPLPVTAQHLQNVVLGSVVVPVTLKYASNNNPVIGANINILGNDICVNAKTDSTGAAQLSIVTTTVGEELTITATGQDIIPYIGTITVESPNLITETASESINIYPNPFNNLTSITYSVDKNAHIFLGVYNSNGQLVKSLVNEHQNSGNYTITWNGVSDIGEKVEAGVYVCKLETSEKSASTQLIKVK